MAFQLVALYCMRAFVCVCQDYELLCMDGTRRSVDMAASCNWGTVASHIVMTSAMRDQVTRDEYKTLLGLMSDDFGNYVKTVSHLDSTQIYTPK